MGGERDYDALADAVDREASTAELPPVEAYFDDPEARPKRHANGHGGHEIAVENEKPLPPPGAILEWLTFVGKDPPERKWIIPYWIPDSHVTLLSGKGGVGKSLLAQHLGTALAVGVEYMERLESKRVLMWAAEDDADELWRRQLNINSYFESALENLGNFRLRSCVGCDVTLAAPIFNALGKTPMLKTLAEEVKDSKAELVILDNIARIFGGNENDRHQVTTFVAWLQAACMPAAVLLLGHPAKSAGSEFSGSSAWEGAVRARLYFSDRPPDQAADDDEFSVDPQVRYLSRRKANYSELDMRKLNLRDGVLIPEAIRRERRAGQASGEFCRDIVLRAVQKLAEKGMHGTSSTASPSYLPRLAKQYGLLENATESAFVGAMRQMVMDGVLVNAKVGAYANRAAKMGLVESAQMGRTNE
jgi:hypothetical protein